MVLKDIQFDMASNLSKETRDAHNLGEYEGLVAIETLNPNLRIEIKKIENLKQYYLSQGQFLEE